MKRANMDFLFTQKVSEYIAKGYTINTNSMSGTQGEEAKVDLRLGSKLIRVWLNKEYTSHYDDDPSKFHGDVLVLRVGLWTRDANLTDTRYTTVWMKDLETLEQTIYYKIGNKDYYGTKEEAIAAQQVRRARYRTTRYENSREIFITDDKAREAGYKFLKRTQGYQRVSFNDIVIRKRINENNPNTYFVVYHNRAYRMQ